MFHTVFMNLQKRQDQSNEEYPTDVYMLLEFFLIIFWNTVGNFNNFHLWINFKLWIRHEQKKKQQTEQP